MDTSTASGSTMKALGEPEGKKPTKTQKLQKVFKEYGAVGVSFHICISLMSLGIFYFLMSRYHNIITTTLYLLNKVQRLMSNHIFIKLHTDPQQDKENERFIL